MKLTVNRSGRRRRRPLTRRGLIAYAVVFTVLGLFLLGLGVRTVQGHQVEQRIDAGPQVNAMVMSSRVTTTHGKHGPYHHSAYRVAFQTATGTEVRTTIRVEGWDPCACAQTLIAYDPRRPEDARIVGTAHRDSLWDAAVVGLAGAVLLGLAALFAWASRRVGWTGVVPAWRPGRHRRLLLTVLLPLPLAVALIGMSGFYGQGQPAHAFFVRNLALGAAGQGTGGCLGLPASSATPALPSAVDLGVLHAAAAAALRAHGTGFAADGAVPQLGTPDIRRTWTALGGGVPAPGAAAADAYVLNGSFPFPGFASVTDRTLRDPVAAARWQDAFEAARCYLARGRGDGMARALQPPAQQSPALPAGARFFQTPCGCDQRGLTRVYAGATVGRYAVVVLVVGAPQDVGTLTARAGAFLAAATTPG